MLETARTLARGNPWAFQMWYTGLTPEERLGLKATLAFNAVRKAIESMADVFEQIGQAIIEAIQAIVKWGKTFYPILFEFDTCLDPCLRLLLYDRLIRCHLPYWLALPLARRCPRRWLEAVTG